MYSAKVQMSNESLSKRAVEILRLLAEGLSDREIAEQLVMTINTVKWYNRQIYSILDVGSRTQAIARARELHLLEDDSEAAPMPAMSRNNLPVETTHFVGRKHHLEATVRLFNTTRLLTLVGPPGTGKTRLALRLAKEVSDTFRDGVYFIPLAPINDPSLIVSNIAMAIGIKEINDRPLLDILKQVLRVRHTLLVLDNFEHVLSGSKQISELLSVAPQIKVLATSRQPLHLYGEQEYVVPPLELPSPSQSDPMVLADCEATALFVQQARAVLPNFQLTKENAQDVAEICVRLEGLPLAIELAAARTKLLNPRMLLSRLERRLDTLTGGAHDLPKHQQTLRSTIDWSYNLLGEAEKILLARLGVFSGGWSLEAAEAVCAENLPVTILDGLASLMDKSLIQQSADDSGEPRFTMLETIREYALERLKEMGDEATLQSRHAAYFTNFAEHSVNGPHRNYASADLTRLEMEQNNFRAVLSRSLVGNPEPGLRLIGALGMCWRIRSYTVEGFDWAQRLLDVGTNVTPEVRANALSSTSRLLASFLGNYNEADHMSREALAIAREAGSPHSTAAALHARGAALMENDLREARLYLNEALDMFRKLDDTWGIALTLNSLGEVARLEDNDEEAEKFYEEAMPFIQKLGNLVGVNQVLQNLAYIAQHKGNIKQARALFTEGLKNAQELNDEFSIANCLVGIAGLFAIEDKPRGAAQLFGAAEKLRDNIGARIQPGDRPDYQNNLNLTRSLLDSQSLEICWADGRMMTMEQAIEFALQP